jgi:exopolyphosphatase/guanosine-5'-triphosphate,3'-diphosphate pyrophosphatase
VKVSKLASILRIADGLDRGHQGHIRKLRVEVTAGELVLWVKTAGELVLEEWALKSKADFFKSLYGLEVVARREK